jgi:cytochrome c-type biogenesis protein CcmH
MKKLFAFVLIAAFMTTVFASVQDIYSFSSNVEKKRFTHLTKQYRCLVCQNETLADSNAPLAKDLRKQVAELINGGATDAQITHYLVKRYGDYILFHPAVEPTTYLLWASPFILLLIGLYVVVFIIYRKFMPTPSLTPQQKKHLDDLLEKNSGKN